MSGPPSPIVVIPVHDEAPTLAAVVAAARAYAPVIVVDDGSTDGGGALARAAGADVIGHARRLGKGQALRTGAAAARIRGASHAITLDGDGQHDPRDLPVLLEALRSRPSALVIGRRRAGAGVSRGRANAVRIAGFFANWASGQVVHDTQSGYRVYPIALLDELHPRTGGFVFETEVLVEAVRHGWEVLEVDVGVSPRVTRRSRFRPVVDGAAIGVYLGVRVGARWGREIVAALSEATSFLRPDVRRARHAAVMADASRYADAPGQLAIAFGLGSLRRATQCLGTWWRHPRLRRAGVAATGTLAMPVLAAAAAVQALVPGPSFDIVTPLVDRWYSQDRLGAAPLIAEQTSRRVEERHGSPGTLGALGGVEERHGSPGTLGALGG
ncbi:MAG: glycosyltransferase family 2 protein, partial [Candidatus Rokubacteria bacterium]|nr:glycosyltransferase family 2 protein [Candidatus Rokubacteria bacterium]